MKTRTDCPPDFHGHAALAALAAALGNHCWTHGWTSNIYPNLWIILIAPSGFGKSAPLHMVEKLIHKAGLGQLIYPNSFSPEAFMTTAAKQPNGLFIHQEFSSFLELMNREYMAGMIPF